MRSIKFRGRCPGPNYPSTKTGVKSGGNHVGPTGK